MKRDQLDLFGTDPRILARARDPRTSKAAAIQLNATKMEAAVLEVCRGLPEKFTADDVRNAMPAYAHSAHKRVSSLLQKGFLKDTGEETKSKLGRMQRVLRVKER